MFSSTQPVNAAEASLASGARGCRGLDGQVVDGGILDVLGYRSGQ
ncbi:MAG TPA: hypothetical protein VKB87_06795 [Myxococcaceae bacterium]|nr:hypothetical protein [Myxococcaceae bacterium]